MEEERGTGGDGSNPRDEYMKRFGLWVLIALALVFLIVAYSMVYDSLVGRITPTIVVRQGTIEKFASCKALVIRDERLVLATAAGTLNVVASEGERLAKGGLAARIGGKPEAGLAGSEGKESEQKAEVSYLLLGKAEAALNDARLMLSSKETELAIYVRRGDAKEAERLKQEVEEANARVTEAVAAQATALKDYESALDELGRAESARKTDEDPGGIDIRTSRQAVVSYGWDGLEQRLSPSNPDLLETEYSAADAAVAGSRKQGDALAKGDVVFREIGSLSTDVLLFLDGVDPQFLETRQVHKLRFTRISSEKVAAKLKASKDNEDGSVRAYFSLDRYVNSMTSMRTAEVDLLLESYSGLIVPARAITTEGGRSVVHVMRQDRFVEVEVEVFGIVAGEAAVRSKSLRQGDKVRYDG